MSTTDTRFRAEELAANILESPDVLLITGKVLDGLAERTISDPTLEIMATVGNFKQRLALGLAALCSDPHPGETSMDSGQDRILLRAAHSYLRDWRTARPLQRRESWTVFACELLSGTEIAVRCRGRKPYETAENLAHALNVLKGEPRALVYWCAETYSPALLREATDNGLIRCQMEDADPTLGSTPYAEGPPLYVNDDNFESAWTALSEVGEDHPALDLVDYLYQQAGS